MLDDIRWRKAAAVSGIIHIVAVGCIGYAARNVFVPKQQESTMQVIWLDEQGLIPIGDEEIKVNQGNNGEASEQAESDIAAGRLGNLDQTATDAAAVTAELVNMAIESKEIYGYDDGSNLAAGSSEIVMDGNIEGLSELSPVALYQPEPVYTELTDAGDFVVIKVQIAENGSVIHAEVGASSGNEILEQAALHFAQIWMFEPVMNDEDVAISCSKEIRFPPQTKENFQ